MLEAKMVEEGGGQEQLSASGLVEENNQNE